MADKCEEIHELFNGTKRFHFPFDKGEIPQNGIYILFETGEHAHKVERIVRVGTHTGRNQLLSRLLQHFINENKDRSIFRKNIGRAVLNMNKDPFLEKWDLDLTTKESKEKNLPFVDMTKQKTTESLVSQYIQKNFSFAVFPIEDKGERLELESKIISTISHCEKCKPSKSWLGLFSPKEKIRKSGLWLVNELWKTPLSEEDLVKLRKFSNV
ncbi:MAG TPA: hypothetical protein VJZ93_04395 [Candidatus Nanoarchaeia archaeon]|nr:hypothetical protein [Candidatus Nanoarchaeia archaeon]